MSKSKKMSIVVSERIERRIYLIRDQKVLLSPDLAQLYEVEPRILIQAVKRNLDRFPGDFMFQLTNEESQILRSQSVILGHGTYSKYPPYAFTEQGVAMLSSVLRSKRAVQVNIEIMRAFVRLREVLASQEDISERLEDLEVRMEGKFSIVFEAIDKLMEPPKKSNRKVGFLIDR
jgi:hypothetical protein